MRFFQNGPSIPDDLLNARDKGRVVFFCGAGVSRARAELSDFFELAEAVIRRLGVPADSAAKKIRNCPGSEPAVTRCADERSGFRGFP